MGPLCVTADIFHIHKLGLLETQRMTQIPGDICYTYDPSIVHSTEKKTGRFSQVELFSREICWNLHAGCLSTSLISPSSHLLFSFSTLKSQKPLISPSTSSLDSQPRWAFLLRGFIFRVLLLLSPVLVHAKNDKIALWRKSQQVSSQMQFLFYLQRRMKFALESKSIRSYHSNFWEMSKTKVRFPF